MKLINSLIKNAKENIGRAQDGPVLGSGEEATSTGSCRGSNKEKWASLEKFEGIADVRRVKIFPRKFDS